ncbi:glycosyltransferase family 4 protein [Sphingobacterium pedocola]|uniref:Glycosyltransferase family 1 protein n=1 Tax=Sphingobacterium pedocola TaxID=2082722 RepID=A0ABR9T4Q1_9SPHI|nr:glycosyltransferase family 4 protein [Sphingobacterium pedocola]MBE8720049.1 glycosyltransferase family 1 protein [Sphingobacterium pedocola]
MRILVVHNYYQHQGGEDMVFHQEINALRQDHEVTELTFQNKTGFSGLLQFLSYPFNLIASNRIKRAIKDSRPDVVHIHNIHYASGPMIISAVNSSRIPIVMTLHNYRLICPSATLFYKNSIFTNSLTENFPWTAVKLGVLDNSVLKSFWVACSYWIHKKLGTFHKINTFIVLSDFAKSVFLKSKINLPSDNFAVKGNYVADPQMSPQAKGESFIFIGRLAEEKGILPLIEALKGTSHFLKIFGAGPQQHEVERLTADVPNITYFGFQENDVIQQHLIDANALLVPSICYEGMPMTILESFALSTPVISSNIGILAKMVIPLYTGLHFDPFEKRSIIASLDQWQSLDSSVKSSIGANCRKEYIDKYTPTRNMSTLIAIYKNVILNTKQS